MRDIPIQSRYPEKTVDFSFRDIVTPLFRKKWLILISFLVLAVLLITAALVRGSVYESHLSILVSRERQDPLVTSQATGQMIGTIPPLTDEEVNSESELLKSSDVLTQVVLANGMQKPGDKSIFDLLHPNETDEDRAARAARGLAHKLKIELPTKTNLIEVTYSSSNPQRAYKILKSLSDYYLTKHAAVHRPQGSYGFFADETARYKAALGDSEARLRELGEKDNVADPDEEQKDLSLELATKIGQLHATEQALAADRQRIISDREQMSHTPERSATKQDNTPADVLLQQLGASELAAETRRTQLLAKYKPDFPLVKEADQEVEQVRAAIAQAQQTRFNNSETDRDPTYELLREDLAKSQSDLAAQQASLAANRESVASMQHQMVQLGSQSLQLADLEREAKANEQNYLLYLAKREQARTSDALDQNKIANVAIAVPPSIPVLPVHGMLFNIVIALALAVILSLALGYFAHFMDPSFYSATQTAEVLRMPVIVMHKRRA